MNTLVVLLPCCSSSSGPNLPHTAARPPASQPASSAPGSKTQSGRSNDTDDNRTRSFTAAAQHVSNIVGF
ncbi:hypothetical protein E2C01_074397 [Portunus trituberculatus]|uniref:Uncharacterized protein n=1 Tax=Portunus trituberculatus TaxID=210409 RepID=A0A5B7ID32_PORTR|nr:hypothetical protein [Portunus trituberculatus]